MKPKYTLLYISLLSALLGCTPTENVRPVPVTDLVEIAYHYPSYSVARQDSIREADSSAINALLAVMGDSTLQQWSHTRAVRVFSPDVQRVYPTVTPLEGALGYTLAKGEELCTDFPKRQYAAVAYGRPEAILFVDSVMLIGLNHFLGADYPGYAGMPEYLKQLKTPEQLPYAIAEALTGTQYPYTDEANTTLLSRMLYEGALVRAKMQLVNHARPAEALGYSDEIYTQLIKDEADIWESLVQSQLIFDTSEATIERVCSPAPFVRVGGHQWPGRVGRFIGWRIVEAYAKKHPNQPLTDYLTPSFYTNDRTLAESGY